MKTPNWSVLVVALLLGLVTGDFLVHSKPAEAKQQEVNVQLPPQALSLEEYGNYLE